MESTMRADKQSKLAILSIAPSARAGMTILAFAVGLSACGENPEKPRRLMNVTNEFITSNTGHYQSQSGEQIKINADRSLSHLYSESLEVMLRNDSTTVEMTVDGSRVSRLERSSFHDLDRLAAGATESAALTCHYSRLGEINSVGLVPKTGKPANLKSKISALISQYPDTSYVLELSFGKFDSRNFELSDFNSSTQAPLFKKWNLAEKDKTLAEICAESMTRNSYRSKTWFPSTSQQVTVPVQEYNQDSIRLSGAQHYGTSPDFETKSLVDTAKLTFWRAEIENPSVKSHVLTWLSRGLSQFESFTHNGSTAWKPVPGGSKVMFNAKASEMKISADEGACSYTIEASIADIIVPTTTFKGSRESLYQFNLENVRGDIGDNDWQTHCRFVSALLANANENNGSSTIYLRTGTSYDSTIRFELEKSNSYYTESIDALKLNVGGADK